MTELIVVTVVATILGTLLALEAKAWLPYVGRRVLSRAIGRFPEEIGEATRRRWGKEIEGDFQEFADRPLSGLLFALRVLLKGGRDLAAELALEEKIAEGGEEKAVARPAQLPNMPPPTVEPLVEALLRFFKEIGIPWGEATQSLAIRILNTHLAGAYDEETAAALRRQIVLKLALGAERYAAEVLDRRVTASELEWFAWRLSVSASGEERR